MWSAKLMSLLMASVANMFTPVAFGPATLSLNDPLARNTPAVSVVPAAPADDQTSPSSGLTLTLHGWLPFWAKASGTKELSDHLDYFTTISPFSFDVDDNGKLIDHFSGDKALWSKYDGASSTHRIKVVPSIAWFKGDQIDATLSSPIRRAIHIAGIVKAVKKGGYDGIDIDYEGKYLRTKDAYSAFIKELSLALAKDKKILQCTVEARTPAEDRYAKVPSIISHSSDYKVLGDYCDTVRIMAYDQQADDRSLVLGSDDPYYFPIADSVWVEKVIKEAIYEIDRKKIVLGIPTYGYISQATRASGRTTYKHIGALNFGDAAKRAAQYKQIPMRNAASELQYGYIKDGVQYFVSYTDAVAIKKKLLLAQKYGLNGVSIFKIDGGMDPRTWDELSQVIKRV